MAQSILGFAALAAHVLSNGGGPAAAVISYRITRAGFDTSGVKLELTGLCSK